MFFPSQTLRSGALFDCPGVLRCYFHSLQFQPVILRMLYSSRRFASSLTASWFGIVEKLLEVVFFGISVASGRNASFFRLIWHGCSVALFRQYSYGDFWLSQGKIFRKWTIQSLNRPQWAKHFLVMSLSSKNFGKYVCSNSVAVLILSCSSGS